MTMEKVMEKTMEIQDKKQGKNKQTKQLALWIGALILGAILGALGIEVLSGTSELPQNLEQTSYYDHILGVIPNNIIKPFAEGNVLSILLLAAAAGIALAKMPQSNKKIHWASMLPSSWVAMSSSSSSSCHCSYWQGASILCVH